MLGLWFPGYVLGCSDMVSAYPSGDLLVLVVLHQALHVPQLSVQLDLIIVDHVQLPAQVGHVGLEHGLNVGALRPLALQQFPLGLQHLVLLLQVAHLMGEQVEVEQVRQVG